MIATRQSFRESFSKLNVFREIDSIYKTNFFYQMTQLFQNTIPKIHEHLHLTFRFYGIFRNKKDRTQEFRKCTLHPKKGKV